MKPFLLVGHSRPLTKVMFNWTGDVLFSSCIGGQLCAWNPDDATLLRRYKFVVKNQPVSKAIWQFDVTIDGERLLVASAEGIFIFDVRTGDQLYHTPIDAVCRAVQWNKKPDEQTRFVAARDEFSDIPMAILFYKFTPSSDGNREYCKRLFEITDFTSKCVGLSWGPFDETVISWHDDGTIYTWDAETGAKLAEAKHFSKKVTAMDFNEDRTFCLCSSLDKTAKLLFTSTLDVVQTYVTDRPLNACSLSPLMQSTDPAQKKMHILVAGGQSAEEVTTTKTQEGKCEAILMHLVTAEILGLVSGHFSPINTIAFMPDGTGFATGAEEGNVRIYKFDPSYFTNPKYA